MSGHRYWSGSGKKPKTGRTQKIMGLSGSRESRALSSDTSSRVSLCCVRTYPLMVTMISLSYERVCDLFGVDGGYLVSLKLG
jgi:hypothetical protein